MHLIHILTGDLHISQTLRKDQYGEKVSHFIFILLYSNFIYIFFFRNSVQNEIKYIFQLSDSIPLYKVKI